MQTTWLYRLQTGEHRRTNPTIVSNFEEIVYKNVKLSVWDLGGIHLELSACVCVLARPRAAACPSCLARQVNTLREIFRLKLVREMDLQIF